MLQRLHALVAPALASRLTLLLNHVLSAERIATERLVPHAGRTVALTLAGWPTLLPPPPVLAWRITPAGLLEEASSPDLAAPDLAVRLEASNPALLLVRAMAGEPAQVQVDGNAQLAGDVNWLIQNPVSYTHLACGAARSMPRPTRCASAPSASRWPASRCPSMATASRCATGSMCRTTACLLYTSRCV